MSPQPEGNDKSPRRTAAETLRQAATLIRERAEKATPGPWVTALEIDGVYAGLCTVVHATPDSAPGKRVVTVDQTRPHHVQREENVKHVASWHPSVALAVADVLDVASRSAAFYGPIPESSLPEHVAAAFALARVYLGGGV